MIALFAQLLITAASLAVPATIGLFVGSVGTPPLRQPYRALVGAGLVALGALGLGALSGAGPWRTLLVAALLGSAVLASGRVGTPWTLRGLLAWSMTVSAGAAYLAYVAVWTFSTPLSPTARLGGGVLWLLELFVFVLALGYVWELVDVLARWDWRRRTLIRRELSVPGSRTGPFVSLHVPTHNEPPELVIQTLQALLDLEYDDYEVLVLDNNTVEEAIWRPVEEFCAGHERLRFFHLADWPGYKSGALNYALAQVDPRTEIVGVVDADYLVDADFLARCVPLFADPGLAFVQTPQDYRDWESEGYFRRLYYSYSYFFDVSQRSRNERNGAIFGGTMGLIRHSALVAVGNWDEWCITEDAELSLRLLRAGWSGTHVEHAFGRGIMPLTFEALKRQRFRWCFGGVQILRMHAGSLLPGRRTEANRLTAAQRWAYLSGGLQWFGDLVGLLFTAFLLVGALNVFLGDGLVLRRFSGPLLIVVVGLVGLGALRSVALLRRAGGARWRDAFGAFGLWLALGWVVALASFRGLFARQGAFLRTPKTRGDVRWLDALRGNRVETGLALLCLAGSVLGLLAAVRDGVAGGAAVAALLLIQTAGYAAAPLNSLAAIRVDLSPELRRRRDKGLAWSGVSPRVRRWGLGPVLGAALIAGVVVAFAAPVGAPQLRDLPGDAVPERHPHTPAPRPAGTGGPSPTAGSSTPAGGPSGAGSPSPGAASGSPVGTPSATAKPGRQPTATPTQVPTPTARPTGRPTATPTSPATRKPTASPTNKPTTSPTVRPTGRPSTAPPHP